MRYNWTIKNEHSSGRKDLGGGFQVAETEQEALDKFDKEIKFWENESKEEGEAIVVTLECKDPQHIVKQQTVRG